jgi:hypothetical protein
LEAMCLHLFPPSRTRRYAPTRRFTKGDFTQQNAATCEWHEPLRGFGIRRDPLNIAREDAPSIAAAPAVLRGHGVKRDARRRQADYAAPPLPVPVEYAKAQSVRVRLREPSSRYREPHRAEPIVPASDSRYSRRFHPTSRDIPLSFTNNYHTLESYYFDICAVRAATNRALQVTIREPTRPLPKSHRLRRQPAYSQLRYRST